MRTNFQVDFLAHVYFQPTVHRSQNLVDFLPLSQAWNGKKFFKWLSCTTYNKFKLIKLKSSYFFSFHALPYRVEKKHCYYINPWLSENFLYTVWNMYQTLTLGDSPHKMENKGGDSLPPETLGFNWIVPRIKLLLCIT